MAELTLEGWLSVRAALITENRTIHEVLVQKGKANARIEGIKKRAEEQRIPFKVVDENNLLKLTEGQTHGGVVAIVSERKFLALEDIGNGPQATFLAMLDGVEDPFNFGQAVRALWACGVHGLLVRPRNWMTAAATVGRASAGASEFMPMAVTKSDDELLSTLTSRQLSLICSGLADSAVTPDKARLSAPLLLVVGGERRGVSKQLLKNADTLIQIPYGRNFKQALGVTSSTAILAYEVMKQRSNSPKRR